MSEAPAPDLVVRSTDGTPIAAFRSGTGPPLLLVHGAAADHTTWRVAGPLLGARFETWAMDRRGRGASGDAAGYAIEREYEDVGAVAAALAARSGGPVPVVGHSYGGRVALGAAVLDRSPMRGLVVYEGAPPAAGRPYDQPAMVARLSALRDEGRLETLLRTFLGEVVGFSASEIEAYRTTPVWPLRVAAAGTIVRELEAGATPEAGLERLGGAGLPVLQVLGGDSRPTFAAGVHALDERLADGRVEVIPGARHGAHHTHPEAFVRLVTGFVERL